MASDGKGCRDLRPLIRSRCKGVLKQDNEWKEELSCVTLERISGRFPSVDQSSRFAGVPSLGKPLYREKAVYIKTHKTATNRPVDHTGEM